MALAAFQSPDFTPSGEPPPDIADRQTIERPYGWVFFARFGPAPVAGNAPVLVTRSDGLVRMLGTAHPVDWYLANFEATGDLFTLPAGAATAERAARQRERALRRAVGGVLRRNWDPLGVADNPEPTKQYDGYLDRICGLLLAGASSRAIAEHLVGLETQILGHKDTDPGLLVPLAESLRQLAGRLGVGARAP